MPHLRTVLLLAMLISASDMTFTADAVALLEVSVKSVCSEKLFISRSVFVSVSVQRPPTARGRCRLSARWMRMLTP